MINVVFMAPGEQATGNDYNYASNCVYEYVSQHQSPTMLEGCLLLRGNRSYIVLRDQMIARIPVMDECLEERVYPKTGGLIGSWDIVNLCQAPA